MAILDGGLLSEIWHHLLYEPGWYRGSCGLIGLAPPRKCTPACDAQLLPSPHVAGP